MSGQKQGELEVDIYMWRLYMWCETLSSIVCGTPEVGTILYPQAPATHFLNL